MEEYVMDLNSPKPCKWTLQVFLEDPVFHMHKANYYLFLEPLSLVQKYF